MEPCRQITPDAKLGRITGAHRLLAWGTRPLGAIVGGLIAQLLGLQAVFAIMTGVVVTLLVLMRYLTEADIALAERESDEP